MTISLHESIKGVDVTQVGHSTEPAVPLNIPGAVHPTGDGVHECGDLTSVALRTSRETLASDFSDPDRFLEGVVEILDVGNEGLRISSVPMEGNSVNIATIAGVHEVAQPSLAHGGRGGSGTDEVVALVLERSKVALPNIGSLPSTHLGLAGMIRLVEAQGNIGIARLDKTSECIDLLCTPKHRSELEPKLIGICGFVGTPRVDSADFRRFPTSERDVVTVGPGEASFTIATTSAIVAARVSATAIVVGRSGSLGGRRRSASRRRPNRSRSRCGRSGRRTDR